MMKHLKQLNGIRGLLPYLKTKRPTILLIFCLSVIDAGLSLLPIQIIAAVVDLLSTGRSAFSPILGTSLTLHLVFFGVVYALKHAVSLTYGHTNTMLSTGIIESLRDDAMTWALESYKPYKEERREGDIVSRISGDVEAVVRAVAGPLNGLLPMVLKMDWLCRHDVRLEPGPRRDLAGTGAPAVCCQQARGGQKQGDRD